MGRRQWRSRYNKHKSIGNKKKHKNNSNNDNTAIQNTNTNRSIMEGMSARSLKTLEEHEGASGGVAVHWRSTGEFGAGSAHISRRGGTRADTLS